MKKTVSKILIISSVITMSLGGLSGCGVKNNDEDINSAKTIEGKSSDTDSDSGYDKKADSEISSSEGSNSESSNDDKAENSIGELEIKNGQTLERDIIPKIAKLYGIADDEVKSVFSKAESEIINPDIKDWRKMEGIIIPGQYSVEEEDLEKQMKVFIEQAESRYKKIETEVEEEQKNGLTAQERIVLASMVESECLAGEKRQETANVFLNRLSANSKLQSCVTAEYALGYQRPYLTFDDIEIESDYNTYQKSGLPIGPISSFSDESLKYTFGKSTDENLNYFFYDYVTGDMSFYSDFEKFESDGKITMDRFDKESKEGKFDKVNKQELYGK